MNMNPDNELLFSIKTLMASMEGNVVGYGKIYGSLLKKSENANFDAVSESNVILAIGEQYGKPLMNRVSPMGRKIYVKDEELGTLYIKIELF